MDQQTDILNRMKDVTGARLADLARAEEEYRALISASEEALVVCTQTYRETCVGFITAKLKAAFEIIHSDPKEYFKSLADELQRPFVYAWEHMHESWPYSATTQRHDRKSLQCITLHVPGTARLKNIVAGLNLIAKKGDNPANAEGPIIHQHSERVWRFTFVGVDGVELFLGWLDQCRKDPVFRITLKNNLRR